MPEMDFVFFCLTVGTYGWGQVEEKGFIRLPEPSHDGKVSVERAIKEWRTIKGLPAKTPYPGPIVTTVLVSQREADDIKAYQEK